MDKMIALVQCYIHHMKGKEVEIALPKNEREVLLLNTAYIIAVNNLKIV